MTRSVTTGAALALVLAFSATTVAVAQDGVPAEPVENPNTGEISDTLIPQADAFETYAEHISVLNDCDWLGLMAQYPNDAEVHLPQGTLVKVARLSVTCSPVSSLTPPTVGCAASPSARSRASR